MGEVVRNLWITQTIDCATYQFQLELSQLGVERLKTRRLLGLFDIRKSKFEFLNDLRDVITEEIMQKFLEIEEQHEKEES